MDLEAKLVENPDFLLEIVRDQSRFNLGISGQISNKKGIRGAARRKPQLFTRDCARSVEIQSRLYLGKSPIKGASQAGFIYDNKHTGQVPASEAEF